MNKDTEKRVLRMVYNETEFSVVDETGERPDFILKDIYGIEFGVEITEHYNSESAARLTNSPNYIDTLLDDNIPAEEKYMHWKDEKILIKDEIIILDENGKEKSSHKVIIQQNPDLVDYLNSIETTIKSKSEKCKSFRTLHHQNLIIYDRSGGTFSLNELKYFYEAFYTPSLITTLQNCYFKEVILIFAFREDWYFLQLKEFLFESRVFLFKFFYEEIRKENPESSIIQFIIDFLYCLDKNGFTDVEVAFEDFKLELFYACVELIILDKTEMNIRATGRNFSRVPIHSNIQDFLQYVVASPDASLYKRFDKYLKKNMFQYNGAVQIDRSIFNSFGKV